MARNEPKDTALRSLALALTLPVTDRSKRKIRELMGLVGRSQLPRKAHVLAASILPRSESAGHFATVHVDRAESAEEPGQPRGQVFDIDLLLRVQPTEAPPDGILKLRREGWDIERLMEVLCATQETALDVLMTSSYRVRRWQTPTQVEARPLMLDGRRLDMRGAEYHADPQTQGGIVRVAWVDLGQGETRVELTRFAQITQGEDVWAREDRQAEEHVRKLSGASPER